MKRVARGHPRGAGPQAVHLHPTQGAPQRQARMGDPEPFPVHSIKLDRDHVCSRQGLPGHLGGPLVMSFFRPILQMRKLRPGEGAQVPKPQSKREAEAGLESSCCLGGLCTPPCLLTPPSSILHHQTAFSLFRGGQPLVSSSCLCGLGRMPA